MGIAAINVNLVEQIELDFAVGHEALDFLGVAGFLVAKLVARKSENTQTCGERKKNKKIELSYKS